MVTIRLVEKIEDLRSIAFLFNQYRMFYEQPNDIEGAYTFLSSHIVNSTSILVGAYIDDKAVGFCQLYPMYSSVSMKKLYVLNDLFVNEASRSLGIGTSILTFVQELAIQRGWKGMVLETGYDNPAQKLYEKMGWKLDTDYKHYAFSC